MINLYTTSTIGNYKTGTVTCTKNSPTVTGTGTTWKEIVNPGDILTLDDDKFYIISAVNSNTSLTLDKNFAENTATNVSYRILLNTAAHFPSDTAAKVERALEQLSDINEAAINNDRTVTAATKVNGKGLSSTMGDINLNPASINTNRGGTINFHYNQNSNVTSSIYESASGVIRMNGQVSLDSGIRGSSWLYTSESNDNNFVEFCGWSSDQYNSSTGRRLGNMRIWRKSDTVDQVDLYSQIPLASDSSQTCSSGINLIARADGTHSELIYANPATGNNSTQIATTAFVNNYTHYAIPHFIQMGSTTNQTVTFPMRSNMAIVFAMRGSASKIMIFDTWTSSPTVYSSGTLNVTGSMANNNITIVNNNGNAVVVAAFTCINQTGGNWNW